MRITLTNSRGEKLALSNLSKGYRVSSIDGLNPADADIATTAFALSDGCLVTNRRIPKRNIVINFYLVNPFHEQGKLELYSFLRPKDWIRFDYKTANIEAYATGYVESFEAKTWQLMPSFQLSIICADPYFYSPTIQKYTWAPVIGAFEFPFTIPISEGIEFSYINDSDTVTIINSGHESGMTITADFSDAASYLKIYNVLTDGYLKIDYDFQAGDILTITTGDLKKSVVLKRHSKEYNLINYFDLNSTWLTLGQGRNEFQYISDKMESIGISISYSTRYLGV